MNENYEKISCQSIENKKKASVNTEALIFIKRLKLCVWFYRYERSVVCFLSENYFTIY